MKKVIANNKRVYHDYFVDETYDAGIVLQGTEAKSVRENGISFNQCYVMIENGEVMLYGMHIKPYKQGNIWNTEPDRKRKLLLHKKEILKLMQKVAEDGYTIIPVEAYFNNQHIKIEIGLCKGKKLYDKRASQKKKDIQKDAEKTYKLSFK